MRAAPYQVRQFEGRAEHSSGRLGWRVVKARGAVSNSISLRFEMWDEFAVDASERFHFVVLRL